MGRLFLGTDVEKMGLTWITLCARYLLALSKISIPYRLRGIFRTLISSSPPAFFSPGCVEGALLFDAKIEADLPSPSSNTRRILDGYLDFCFLREYLTQSKLCSMISMLLNGGYMAHSH